MEVATVLKKWGNSLGIIIPKKDIKLNKLKSNQKIVIYIKTKNTTRVKDIIGLFPQIKESTEKVMKEINKELDIEF